MSLIYHLLQGFFEGMYFHFVSFCISKHLKWNKINAIIVSIQDNEL